MWPSLQTASLIQFWANIFLIGALVVGVVSTFFTVWMGGIKEKYLNQDIANTMQRAAIAEQKAAEVNKRAEQLRADNLALQAGVRPRRLSFMGWTTWPERVAKIYDDLKLHAGTTVLIQVVPDFEAQLFAKDIAMVLEKNGLKPKFVTKKESHISDISFPEGITIFNLSDGKSKTHAAFMLWSAIMEVAVEMGTQPFGAAPSPIQEIDNEPKLGYPYFKPPITGVFIIVGTRKLTPQLLEMQQRELIREHEEYINGLKGLVKQGRKLTMPAADGKQVEVKIGPDGNLVSVDPNRQLAPLFNLTLMGWYGGDLPKFPSDKNKDKP